MVVTLKTVNETKLVLRLTKVLYDFAFTKRFMSRPLRNGKRKCDEIFQGVFICNGNGNYECADAVPCLHA
jgi:hypothetical protein